MLVSLTRVGPTRHSLVKTVLMAGADTGAALREVRLPATPGFVPVTEVRPHDTVPGLLTVRLDGAWLGTPAAREQVFGHLAEVMGSLARAAHSQRGMLLAPGVQPDSAAPRAPLAGDGHGLRTVDDAEQAVLVNLLRRHSPTLIALTGRARVGGPPDRAGSRRLIESREHLATRFLASADTRYLHHFRAELRRTDGISDLLRMDVAPVPATPGSPAEVAVRCVDAQVALADTRAQALLLDALVLRARRMVTRGRRERFVPQDVIDVNRTRAVVHGMRARFVPSERRTGKGPSTTLSAREAGRRLLRDLLPELSLLDATARELLPLLAPLDLPDLGLYGLRAQDLLNRAAHDRAGLAAQAEQALCDPRPGGGVFDRLERTSPGRLRLLLDDWDRMLRDGTAPADTPDTTGERAAAPRRSGRRPDGGGSDGGGRDGGGRDNARDARGGSGTGKGGNRSAGRPRQGPPRNGRRYEGKQQHGKRPGSSGGGDERRDPR